MQWLTLNMPVWGKVTVNRQRSKVNRESRHQGRSKPAQTKQLWDDNQPPLRKPDLVITSSSSVRPDCKIKILLKQKKTSLISAPIVQLSSKKRGKDLLRFNSWRIKVQFLKSKHLPRKNWLPHVTPESSTSMIGDMEVERREEDSEEVGSWKKKSIPGSFWPLVHVEKPV